MSGTVVINSADLLNAVYQQLKSQITKEPEVAKQGYSYIVFTDGANYYARNGSTGQVDFSGTDASTVIQNAINALGNGGKILIKAGTYSIVTPLALKSNTVISGEGPGTILLRSSTPNPYGHMAYSVFHTTGASNVVIKNLVVDGNKSNLSWTGYRWDYEAIVFNNSQNVVIDNVVVRNVKVACGINMLNTQFFAITNSIMHDNGDMSNPDPFADAIHIGLSKYGIVANNLISNVTDTGVACDNSQFITIANNVFYSCKTQAVAWFNANDSWPIPRGVTIANNIMINNGRGVWISLASGANTTPEDIVIANNYMSASCIIIDRGANITITGNRIRSGYYLIAIHGGYGIRIKNNYLTDATYGVYNDVAIGGIEITDNTFDVVTTPIQIVMGTVKLKTAFPLFSVV
jgi:hypothetical protein